MYYDQGEYEVRCEWGLGGVTHLAPASDVVIIVDILSFSTCVDIAVSRGAVIYPYQWRDSTTAEFAAQKGAITATSRRSETGYSLSPSSLLQIAKGAKLVLPSPNGSTLTLSTGSKPTLAGCFRNATPVSVAAQRLGKKILVIAAGERWPDRSLRPAIEDLLGAGALISRLRGAKSPEALAAQNAFAAVAHDIPDQLRTCSSGVELIERGFMNDVRLAGELDISECVPIFSDGAYQALT